MPPVPATTLSAVAAPNQFADCKGRRLAYRSIGVGTPIVLATRFRGNLDTWDPAFLDALAGHGFQVITFDYSGLGLSTGLRSYDLPALAGDILDLIDALGMERVVLGGWSLGGLAAQVFVATHPDRVSHAVLLGTGPPGPTVKDPEAIFFATAAHPENAFEDELILFFEPASTASRAAARRSIDRIAARTADRSVPVPWDWAAAHLAHRTPGPLFPADAVLAALKATTVPLLLIGGDHDVSFPVENWYALNRQLPTLQLVTFPRTGHGPQHQHPDAAAAAIATFVRTTSARGAAGA
jgi:pimeloyl-ACP methyl ester carboxylesterase